MEKIEISHRTVIFTVSFLISLWFLYQIRVILLLIFISLILTAAFGSLVNFLEKVRLPRSLAIFFIYLFIIAILVATFYSIIPPIVEQSVVFLNSLPDILKETGVIDSVKPDMIVPELAAVPGSVFKFLLSAFSNLLGTFTVLVLTFYFLLERKRLPKYLKVLFANKRKEKIVLEVVNKVEKHIGGWVRGQFLLMLIVGFISYIGFKILGLEFAVPLAVLAGLLELVPNIGPTLAAIPAILVGLSMSPALALGALFLSIAVQQLENHIVVPQVMQHAAGINPIISLICLLIGFKLGGAGGAILSLPTFLVLKTVVAEFYLLKRGS